MRLITHNGKGRHRFRQGAIAGCTWRTILKVIVPSTGIEWCCSDLLSLRVFLRLETSDSVPDHSWLSGTRGRLPHEVHDRVFGWVLSLLAEHGLVRGARIGVNTSTMEANAARRHIVRRDTGADYRAMLARTARESGIETPSVEDLVHLDRKRKGRKLSNKAWGSETDRGPASPR